MQKITVIILILLSSLTLAESEPNNEKINQRLDSIERTISQTQADVKIIHRDQLNYQIEKDLLKEAYSSNLSTINLVITMILGFLTIIGFLGVKSISTIKRDFRMELDELIGLKKSLEEKIEEVREKANYSEKEIERISNETEDQKRRLEILEIQEKSESLIIQKNYTRALEYATIGLNLSPDDLQLLYHKSVCLRNLGQLTEAIITIEHALEIDPHDITNLSDIAETYCLVKQPEKSRASITKNKAIFTKEYGPHFEWYLESINAFMRGDIETLQKAVLHFTESPESSSLQIPNWDYSDARRVLNGMKTQPGFDLMDSIINLLEGKS